MDAPKRHFEQVQMEVVRKTATDFSPPVKDGCDDWRQLAIQVQAEADPQRMVDLVQRLLESLDRKIGKSPRRAME
jgi:hypothetical protein